MEVLDQGGSTVAIMAVFYVLPCHSGEVFDTKRAVETVTVKLVPPKSGPMGPNIISELVP